MRPTFAELGKACVEDLLDVREASLFVVHDAWVGYGPDAPIVASYRLERRASGELKGKGTFSVGRRESRTRSVSVNIPAEAAARFLRAIAAAPLEDVARVPDVRVLDDYRHMELVLYVPRVDFGRPGGTVTLFRPGNGDIDPPWTVSVGGERLWANTTHVERAFKALAPLLRREVLEKMTT